MTLSRVLVGLLLVATTALVACQDNPNEHVQSNEFFRAPAEQEQQAVSDAESDQSSEQGEATQSQQSAQADQSESVAEGQSQQDEQSPASAQDQDGQPQEQQDEQADNSGSEATGADVDEQDDTPLQTSDDVIRRYANPTYGYSFELICSPFCDPSSNGIDSVSFLSETGRALVGVDVAIATSDDADTNMFEALGLGDSVEFESREETTTVTGEAAIRYTWEEDRRATGGFQVRWHALYVAVDDLAIILRAGAVLEDYEGVAPSLERALTSFILPLEVSGRPGRYDRFGFAIEYDTADNPQEYGQPTVNPPSEEAGIFVLQSQTTLRAVMTWQVLGEAFYSGESAIEQSLSDSLGIESVTDIRDWGEVDGNVATTGQSETQFGEGVLQIQSYAWYCRDSGREFALHVLDPDDPGSVALPLIESFRCDAEAADADADQAGADEETSE